MKDLITLDEYKESKGITSVKEDLMLISLIASVSQLVKTYCGTSFVDHFTVAEPKLEVISVNYNLSGIQLTECPANTIISVEERTGFLEPYKALTVSEYYLETTTDTVIRISNGSEGLWAKGPGSVKIEYTAGYSDIPADLKLAVYDTVTYYVKDEYKARKTLSGATVENMNTSSQNMSVSFPDHIKRVLDLYRTV